MSNLVRGVEHFSQGANSQSYVDDPFSRSGRWEKAGDPFGEVWLLISVASYLELLINNFPEICEDKFVKFEKKH